MLLRFLMTILSLAATPAAAQPEVLQSGVHDLISVHYSAGPLQDAVLVCLRNRNRDGVKKTLRNHVDGPPRISLPDMGQGCVAFQPTRHVFFFQKQRGEVPMTVLSVPMDLTQRAGQQLMFDWLRDSAP